MVDVEEKISVAKLAEQAERYDDMADSMKDVIKIKATKVVSLTNEERNLLSVAFKNVVGSKRSAWRIVSSIESKLRGGDSGEENSKMKLELATEYKGKIEKELREVCNQVIVSRNQT